MKSLALAAILATSAGVASAAPLGLTCEGSFYTSGVKEYDMTTSIFVYDDVITTGANLFNQYFSTYEAGDEIENVINHGYVNITDDTIKAKKTYLNGDLFEETVLTINRYTGSFLWQDASSVGDNTVIYSATGTCKQERKKF